MGPVFMDQFNEYWSVVSYLIFIERAVFVTVDLFLHVAKIHGLLDDA